MKTTAIIFGLVAALSLSIAGAEPFKEKSSQAFFDSVHSSDTRRQAVTPSVDHYNRRGVDWTAEAPAGSNRPLPDVRVSIRGYNDRSHVMYRDFREIAKDRRVGGNLRDFSRGWKR